MDSNGVDSIAVGLSLICGVRTETDRNVRTGGKQGRSKRVKAGQDIFIALRSFWWDALEHFLRDNVLKEREVQTQTRFGICAPGSGFY